jgi:hypothetical protein
MSVTTEELRVKLIDAKKAETELRGVRKELEGTTGATTKAGKESEKAAKGHHVLSGALGSLGTTLKYAGGFVGLYGLAEGAKGVVQGGLEAEEQHKLLANALTATGQAGAGAYGRINKAIQQSSTHGGFSKVEETEGVAQLTRETKSYTVALKENQAVVTLSRGLHQGYAQTLTQVQRLETGTPGRLTKLIGPYVAVKYYVDQLTASQKKRFPAMVKEAELKDKEATATQLNQKIQERYGTAVVAYNSSTQGALTNTKNTVKEAEEELGEKLAPTIKEVAVGFSEVVREMMKGEGVWKTVGTVAKTFYEALKGVWTYLEKNKLALQGFEGLLGVLATAWGTEKVVKFGTALKDLKLVSLVQGLTPAMAAFAPELLAVGAAVALVYEGVKHAKEIREFFGLGGTKYVKPGSLPARKAKAEQEVDAYDIVHHIKLPTPVPGGINSALAGVTGGTGAGTTKIELHVDSKKVAEAMLHNYNSRRLLAESVTKHSLGRQALS